MKKILFGLALVLSPFLAHADEGQIRQDIFAQMVASITAQIKVIDIILTLEKQSADQSQFAAVNALLQNQINEMMAGVKAFTDLTPAPIVLQTPPPAPVVPPVYTPPMPNPAPSGGPTNPTPPAAPAVVSATLGMSTLAYQKTQMFPSVFTLVIHNGRSEDLVFATNAMSGVHITTSDLASPPEIHGIYKSKDITSGNYARMLIPANGDATVYFNLATPIVSAGSFSVAIDSLKMFGWVTGDTIEVQGLPLTIGPITVE